jgi:hypothetical protein
MRYISKRILTCGAAMLLALSGCGADDDGDEKKDGGADSVSTKCETVGKTTSCRCSDGTKGARYCLSSGTYSECACGSSNESCTTAGKQFNCECDSGSKGTRVCLASGYFSKCSCAQKSAPCCHDLGSCMASKDLPEDSVSMLGADTCPEDSEQLCVPDSFVASKVPALCHSVNGAEGRCLPDCLPTVTEQASVLPKDTCPEFHKCVPCIDPIKGYWTGACGLFDDPGQREPTRVFESCCAGRGYCVSPELVSEDQRSFLGTDTCPDSQELLCAPAIFVDDPNFSPTACRSISDAEGRCLPSCLPVITDQPITLPRDVCEDGYSCAPCFDPVTGGETEACKLPNDPGPAESPVEYGRCCDGIGACLPKDVVPENLRDYFGEDTCRANEGLLCTPDAFATRAHYVPTSCRSIAQAEGRCLPKCIPELANQSVEFPQDICPDKFACAPCYDPRTGELTPVCTSPDDPGPKEAPKVFDRCCNGIGSCLSESLILESKNAAEAADLIASQLIEGSCDPDKGLLCTPDVFVDIENYLPPKCRSFRNTEGRCTPDCISRISDQRIILPKEDCPAHFSCAPCYDPVDGEATGICDFSTDQPTEPKYVFRPCCEGSTDAEGNRTYLGTCVPKDLLPASTASALEGGDSSDCTVWESDTVCAPRNLAKGEKLVGCQADIYLDLSNVTFAGISLGKVSLGNQPGACVPTCNIPPDQQSFVVQKSCVAGELCVPCSTIDTLVPGGCNQ